jgi:hypothetical protein
MFEFVIVFLKGLLVPLRATPPTAEQIQAFDDYEDTYGFSSNPSPTENYEMAVEWHEGMIADFSLWTLFQWRLSVAWMPFAHGEQRLLGERLSRWLMPDLWSIRAAKSRAERIAKQNRARRTKQQQAISRDERAAMYRELADIKIEKEGF